MSRAPPFPTNSGRRARSPASSSASYYDDRERNRRDSNVSLPSSVRPLKINRSNTPSNGSMPASPTRSVASAPGGPSRPQRSERRPRQISEYSDSERSLPPARPPRDKRGAGDVSGSSRSGNYPRKDSTSTVGSNSYSRSRSERSNTEDSAKSPAMATVMSAFQSAAARKRAMTNGSDDYEYEQEKRRELELEQQRQKRIRDKVPGRRVNGRTRIGDIDAVLDQIKDEWEFVIDPDFNNVDLALQLLDDSSLGKDMKSFQRTKHMLSKALKGSVDKHYQAFAQALPHHASLLTHLGASQDQIKEARTALQESKDALGSKRADLVQLWSRGQTVEEMIRLLDEIEHLKGVPDVLETLMSEKRLLQASVILVRSLKTINKPDMAEIGAVADLRSYLNGQETALREILIDELQGHLYLKSFWCDSRWTSYTPNQQAFSRVEFEDEPLQSETMKQTFKPPESSSTGARPSRLVRYLHDLAVRPNDPPVDLSEPNLRNSISAASVNGITAAPSLSSYGTMGGASMSSNSRNPESDSFAYMETLLESLAVLGKIGTSLDVIAQRLPGEIYNLVETTLDEVGERAEYGRRGSVLIGSGASTGKVTGVFVFSSGQTTGGAAGSNLGPGIAPKGGLLSASSLRLAALESSAKQIDHEVLKDMFWTIYSKLDAVTQGLRVISEVANRIGSRRDFKDSSGTKPGALFPLAEVWMPVQAEVRTLLYDYLTDDEQGAVSGRNPISSINEILREGKYIRDRTKPVFRFADTDVKYATKALKQHEDELQRVLNDTMPGLVHGSADNTSAALSTLGADDRLLGAGQHHRLLIKPDAFHVSVLFQPTLCYLERVSEILPSGAEAVRSSSLVLDDFVSKVYLPQLEEKVSSLFHQAVTGPEAFQPDPSSTRLSPEPLVKATTQLMALINSLCSMLRTSPFHRESYTRMILSVIIQFYQRCSDRFHDLVTFRSSKAAEADEHVALAAQWAQRSEIGPCLSELLTTPEGESAKLRSLYKQETHLELEWLGPGTVRKEDLIQSIKNLASLSSLYHSVAWFSEELNLLKATPEGAFTPTTPVGLEPPLTAITPSTPFLPTLMPIIANERLTLPLSREMGMRFQALLKTYQQLAEMILQTVRIDIRCRTIHYLDAAMRHGNYFIDREAGEPDPHVVDLNTDIGACDGYVSAALPKDEQRFVFVGLGYLMERMLISNARHLRQVNHFGINKIRRNMLALQQSIRTISYEPKDTEFEHAKRYYALFSVPPNDMLDGLRRQQMFSFDEYKTMLGLQCGVVPGQDGANGQSSDRKYSMYVIELHGMELEDSKDSTM